MLIQSFYIYILNNYVLNTCKKASSTKIIQCEIFLSFFLSQNWYAHRPEDSKPKIVFSFLNWEEKF